MKGGLYIEVDFRVQLHIHHDRDRKVYVVVTKSLGVGQWKFPLYPLRRSILSPCRNVCYTRTIRDTGSFKEERKNISICIFRLNVNRNCASYDGNIER